MILRPYTSEDAATILSWCRDERAFYQWTAGVLGDWPISAEQFDSVRGLMPYVAVDDTGLIGFFTLRRPNEERNELRFGFVIVDPDKRGQGLGKQMLKEGLKMVFGEFGADIASLGVFENNPSAYYCYKAAGFTDITTDPVERYSVLGEEWDCREMQIVNYQK